MKHSKGAEAPFFLPVCVPRLRDDALLAGAIEAFQTGHLADALLVTEYVCRSNSASAVPALLRAKIIESSLPALAASAWYAAWYADPEHYLLQDAMLEAWLRSGASTSVADVGVAFLPGRCRRGQHASLVHLLQQTSLSHVGACWKSDEWVEGRLFDLRASTWGAAVPHATLVISDESSEFHYCVPANGEHFRLKPPRAQGVWSLAYAINSAEPSQHVRMHGSPLVFAGSGAAGEEAVPAKPPSSALVCEPAQGVDIIIPVYRDFAGVQACIASVLTSQQLNHTPSRVIVINDDSPEPELVNWLQTLAETGQITLLTNRHNLGFIGAVNRGLELPGGHDALLLNADTLVHGDWIDRMRTALYSAQDIASVMPWSNNAELGSFPQIAVAAPVPDLAQLAQIDSVASSLRRAGHTDDVEIPSCCGFAMLMRRSVIEQIGVLDGVELTRGYLEEVDWCMRARASAYRHLLATGVFVAHAGSASFRAEKRLRVQQNRKVLLARYPDYYPEYAEFIRDDPLQGARRVFHQALDEAASPWLTRAAKSGTGADFARSVPAPLPSAWVRIAVWQHRMGTTSAPKVLALARILASKPALKLRLLIVGEADEALWHTGVVDIIPVVGPKVITPLTDSALVGLGACAVLLAQDLRSAPSGIHHVALDEQFDPQVWLDEWCQRSIEPYPAKESVKA